jgi:exoribonuclease-2
MRNFEQTYHAYSEFQTRMERYWCLQYVIQEDIKEAHATVWRENLVRLDNPPYMTKVYGLREIKPGTRVSLQVQEVDTLLMELRTKFIGVLVDEPVSTDILAIEDDDTFMDEEGEIDELKVDAVIADNENQEAVA